MLNKKGFTLIELLVVIAIIGILSSVVLAGLSSARAKSRDAKRLSDMHQLQVAVELYYTDNGSYPIELCIPEPPVEGWAGEWVGYDTCWDDLKVKLAPYISNLPQDPLQDDVWWAYYYGTMKGGQGYILVTLTEANNKRGDGCYTDVYDPTGKIWYCIGQNWQ